MINTNELFNLRMNIKCEEELVNFFISSFMFSATFFALAENQIFDNIQKGNNTVGKLSISTGIPKIQMQKLLSFCTSLNLIQHNGYSYANSPLATKLFTSNSTDNILPVLHHMHRHVYSQFGNLTESLKNQKNQSNSISINTNLDNDMNFSDLEFYSLLSNDSYEFQQFLRAMNTFSTGVGADISANIEFHQHDKILDLGCGGGAVSKEIANLNSKLEITLLDLEDGILASKNNFNDYNGDCLIDFHIDNILDNISVKLNNFDYVIISAVLGDWSLDKQVKIISNAYKALKPGGKLIISETLLYENRMGPVLPALMCFYVLLLTEGGTNHDPLSITKLLEENGFNNVLVNDRKHKNLRDIVTAIKNN